MVTRKGIIFILVVGIFLNYGIQEISAYPWGDTISVGDANHHRYINDTVAVGEYAPNGYDMAGLVSIMVYFLSVGRLQ